MVHLPVVRIAALRLAMPVAERALQRTVTGGMVKLANGERRHAYRECDVRRLPHHT